MPYNHLVNQLFNDRLFDDAFFYPALTSIVAVPQQQVLSNNKAKGSSVTKRQNHQLYPRSQFKETETHLIYNVDVPGIDKDQLQVSIKDNVITVEGKQVSEQQENTQPDPNGNGGNEEVHEYFFSSSMRQVHQEFSVPDTGVDLDDIKVAHKNGVLSIAIAKQQPKVEEHEKPRQLQIQ